MAALNRAFPWLFLAVFSLPVLAFILGYGVDVPIQDQWGIAGMYLADNAWTWILDLFRPHNESLLVIPKIIWFGLAKLSGWNLRVELVASWCLLTGTGIVLLSLLGKTFPKDQATVAACSPFVFGLLFSPAQWANFLTGDQMCLYLLLLCAAGAARISVSDLPPRRILLLGAVVSTIGAFSFGSGLLCAAIAPGVLFLRGATRRKALALPLLAYALWTVVLAAIIGWTVVEYVHKDYFPVQAPTTAFEHAAYLLRELAQPALFSRRPGNPQLAVGAIGLVAFGTLCLFETGRRPDQRDSGWIAFSALGLCNALAIAALRGSPGGGLDPRFVTSTSPLLVGLFPLIFSWLPRWRRSWITVATAALAAGGLFAWQLDRAAGSGRVWRQEHLAARAALHFIAFNLSPEVRAKIHEPGALREADKMALLLNARGLMHPPFAVNDELVLAAVDPGVQCLGWLDEAVRVDGKRVHAAGWAPDRRQMAPADAVLLGEVTAGRGKILAVVPLGDARPDVARNQGAQLLHSGWHSEFELKANRSERVLRAWAFDSATAHVWPLCGEQRLSADR